MICKKCGNEIKDETKICPVCGELIDSFITCPTCGSILRQSTEKCPICGEDFSKPVEQTIEKTETPQQNTTNKYCTVCGNKLEVNASFCTKCGAKVGTNHSNNNYVEYNNNNNSTNNGNINKNYSSLSVSLEFNDSKKNSILGIVLYFAIFYLVSPIISSIITLIFKDKLINVDGNLEVNDTYVLVVAIINLVTYLLLFATVFVVKFRDLKQDFIDLKYNKKKLFSNYALTIAFMFAANMIANFIISVLSLLILPSDYPIGDSGNQEMINLMLTSNPVSLVITVLMTVIGAPIIEELVFRKSFFGLSSKKKISIVFISALAFGAIHVVESILNIALSTGDTYAIIQELLYLISYFMSGLALGFGYYQSKSIVPVILAHATWNLLSVILTLLMI